MEILTDNRQTRIEFDSPLLTTRASRVLEDLGCSPSAILSLSIVDADEMAELNRVYRGKDGPTNVLSFAQHEGPPVGPETDLLGDVVICADRAHGDAAELGYSVDEMMAYLLIHGILHLEGYTHDQAMDSSAMAAKVEDIFQKLVPCSEP
ncbi:MAG: rRNA maturation RNase YbeY [Pseudomonadota bacterium]